ncbi:hypothetical protein B0T14DRAFT_465885 [Immersiella caudata]|uniref:Uncharacterized protein n=1 Tax=Immersiella caudata TaxID=314043 RepID=A0AA39WBA7_9PEZI|nr:hypothetical protein B0T14DRAFT_465885 [Immersiella caudata]
MASLGRISNSAVSAVNENTVALVNINLDFSLWRCNPSPEFLPIGSALTRGRRREAETGQAHRTACTLGFLFHETIPSTPKLIKAYGRRVSDILSHPDVNPQGTESDGPFQAFIGADCTTIWAAATSGPSAICVHLLACMLADAWDAKAATAIWFELVEHRKRQVQQDLDEGKLTNPHTSAASQQPYTRAELASWDASARSWLRRAGTCMMVRRTQFALIAENLTVPYPRGANTYETVIATWTRAMEVLEKLLDNLPQEACDRAVIRGISAWHLYPDLLVFQTQATKVSFKDPLFPSSAILSVGLEYKGQPSDNFVRWSLALSHLKFYGDPVAVRSNEQLSRVNISQLWLVALGTIFRQWDIPYASFDVALQWFEELGRKLGKARLGQLPQLSWLARLCSAATGLDGEKGKVATMLVNYGWRRGAKFLGGKSIQNYYPPFLGLGNIRIMRSLSRDNDPDGAIEYFRHICRGLQLNAQDCVITYDATIASEDYTEWATIYPVDEHLADRGPSGPQLNPGKKNIRWLHIELPDDQPRREFIQRLLESRKAQLEAIGEKCMIVTEEGDMLQPYGTGAKGKNEFTWKNPPNLLAGTISRDVIIKHVYGPWSQLTEFYHVWVKEPMYDVCMGNLALSQSGPGQLVSPADALSWLRATPSPNHICAYLLALVSAMPLETSPRRNVHRTNKRKRETTPDALTDTFFITTAAHNTTVEDYDPTSYFSMISSHHRHPRSWSLSLRALEIASEVYSALPRATVSLQVVEMELIKSRWLPLRIQNVDQTDSSFTSQFRDIIRIPLEQHMASLSREQSFACLAMFESGRFNIDPFLLADVVALCSEDSIFVAEMLLSGPGSRLPRAGIRHMVGNVGHAGVVCMVLPEDPRVRAPGHDASVVSHSPYNIGDELIADGFRSTSLHLSFTTWKVPLECGTTGEIDQEIFLLEAVVSVQDKGRWVADINVLGVEREPPIIVSCSCSTKEDLAGKPPTDMQLGIENAVSIGSWDELLDPPPCIGILKTNSNWVARLAAVCLITQEGHGHALGVLEEGADKLCWDCLVRDYTDPEPHMPQRIIL